jgi:nucleoside-diphosphate-sugar epimerase
MPQPYLTQYAASRVVLLGASGFIATALRAHLEAAAIPVLSLRSQQLDLCSDDAASRLVEQLRPDDTVVMLAAITPDKARDTASFLKNLTMMHSVCAALQRRAVRHFVYFSSDAVYGLKDSVISEESPVAPQDLYGAMHLSREIMVQGLAHIPTAILRVTMVYGPGDTHASYGPNLFFKTAASAGNIKLFGAGEDLRDHIHIRDVANIALACIGTRATGILNVATGESNSFQAVAALVAEQFSTPIEIIEVERVQPISYRHYNVTALLKRFPGLRRMSLCDGLRDYRNLTPGT